MLKSLEEALTEEMIKAAVRKALEKHGAGQGRQLDRRTAIERELSLIEAYERNLVDAIAKGQAMDPLTERIRGGSCPWDDATAQGSRERRCQTEVHCQRLAECEGVTLVLDGVSVRAVTRWRSVGVGPPYRRVECHVESLL